MPKKMAQSMAAVLRAPRKLCSFSYVLLVFLLFYLLDVVSITVYDRHAFKHWFLRMHLADAFIQSDLQCIQVIHLY